MSEMALEARPNSPLAPAKPVGCGRREAVHQPRAVLARFNERVLDEARDPSLPLYERLKFLGIVSSNLDEFFMVRVAGLSSSWRSAVAETPADGTAAGRAAGGHLRAGARHGRRAATGCGSDEHPAAAGGDQASSSCSAATPSPPSSGRPRASTTSSAQVFPALTPLAVDPGHPFPHLRNKSLNIAVIAAQAGRAPQGGASTASAARGRAGAERARAPGAAAVADPGSGPSCCSRTLIAAARRRSLPRLRGASTTARLPRHAQLGPHLDEEESEDLLSTIQEELRRRDRGAPVRLEIDRGAPAGPRARR